MLYSLFAVGIVFLCKVTNIRGVQSRVYFTNDSYEWSKAKDQCTLMKNEKNVAHLNFSTGLGWTKYVAKYLPWVEYLGCFEFRNTIELYGPTKQVTEGEQLQECMVNCSGSEFFGLQESTCICLHNYSLAHRQKYIVKPCDTNVATCFGDAFAFCGMGGREFVSVYQNDASVNNQNVYRYKHYNTGNCLEFDNTHRILQPNNCSTKFNSMCFDDVHRGFNAGNTTTWRYAFNDCHPHILANFRAVKSQSPKISAKFWLSHTRRWTRILNVTGFPYYCVAARIQQNGAVEKIIRRCRDHLPALCVEVRKTSTDAPSNKSSTRSIGTTFSNAYSASLRTTLSSQLGAATPALKNTTSRSKVLDRITTFASQFVSTIAALTTPTGRSKEVQETTSSTQDWKVTTFPVVDDSTSTDLPGKEGISAILIIVIVAATILIVIILVTIVLCRRKRNTKVPISNESLPMVGKEAVYAQVNKPTVERESNTSNQNSQPAATDDTYDHMDHRRLSQTLNPTESNYDTMRSIANAGEEESNYDHVTGTKIESKRFVVDGASNYSHVEMEFHEVKDI